MFFDNFYELWSHDYQQITLLLDPRRVKIGLRENLKRGRAFVAGKNYSLNVVNGDSLQQVYTKHFSVVAEVLESPKVALISTNKLTARTTENLSIAFPEPLDEQQLQEYVRITRGKAPDIITLVPGKFVIEELDKGIRKKPLQIY